MRSKHSDCRYFFPVYELNCTLRSAISMKDGYKFKPDINRFSVFVFTSFNHPIAKLGSMCQQHCQDGCSQGTSLGCNWCLGVWGVEGDRLWPHKLELLLQAMFVKLSVETEKSQTKKKNFIGKKTNLEAITNYMWVEDRMMATVKLENETSGRHFEVPKSIILPSSAEAHAIGIGCLTISICFSFEFWGGIDF